MIHVLSSVPTRTLPLLQRILPELTHMQPLQRPPPPSGTAPWSRTTGSTVQRQVSSCSKDPKMLWFETPVAIGYRNRHNAFAADLDRPTEYFHEKTVLSG